VSELPDIGMKNNKAPTFTPSLLERIEIALRDRGVIVFATPTAGARLADDVAGER
jgi:hypothetical protein